MATFKKKITLKEREKKLIVNYFQPLLKKNDLVGLRNYFTDWYNSFSNSPAAYWDEMEIIQLWILQELGEKLYFKDATKVFDCEFADFDNLVSIEIPGHVQVIGAEAFNCNCLSEIKLNEGLKVIGGSAFDCASLKKITIPSSVEHLGEYCFNSCDKLSEIRFKGKTPIEIGYGAFDYTNCKIYVPAGKKVTYDGQQLDAEIEADRIISY